MEVIEQMIARQSITEFLDHLGDRSPTPGGGAACAIAGATACSLARMVAEYSVGKSTEPEAAERVRRLIQMFDRGSAMLRHLADEDVAAYEAMSAARKNRRSANAPSSAAPTAGTEVAVARSGGSNADAEAAWNQAVTSAIAVPLDIAATAATAAASMVELVHDLNTHLADDLFIAVELAHAVVRGAARLVSGNIAELRDPAERERVSRQLEDLVRHVETRSAAALAALSRH